jgi:hypothetical protein
MGAFMAMVAGLKTEIVARFFLALENVALRQQLAVLGRSGKRPKLRQRDRVFWVLLSALWPDWRSALMIVKPDTVLGWRRRGFRLLWCWKSRSRKPGRPRINEEIRRLIRRMCCENPTWGAPRIESELRLLARVYKLRVRDVLTLAAIITYGDRFVTLKCRFRCPFRSFRGNAIGIDLLGVEVFHNWAFVPDDANVCCAHTATAKRVCRAVVRESPKFRAYPSPFQYHFLRPKRCEF